MQNKLFLSILGILFSTLTFAQPASFQPRGVGGGGALFAPSFNPADPNEYYIACDMGELFHMPELGLFYEQVHFNEFGGGHNSKVCFTNTAGLLYSLSYINEIPTPVTSADNGVTWTVLSGTPDIYENYYYIFVDYANSNRILISDYSNIYYSTNGGSSFTAIHAASNASSGIVLGGVLFDNSNIYIGTNDGVLVSTNAGSTWTTATITGIPANEQIWSFAAAKSGGTTRFFCLTGDGADIYTGLVGSDYWGFMRGVYTCDYGVNNWTSALTGINLANDYPMFVAMAENDINIAYLAGGTASSEPIIFKTTNGGASWANTFLTANNQNIHTGWSGQGGDRGWGYGECPFGIAVCAMNSNYVMFGDFGFVHLSRDGGISWGQAYVDESDGHFINTPTPTGQSYHSIGLENTTCWQVHWSSPYDMWACYSDIRGIRSTDGGESWSFNYTNHTANSSYRIAQNAGGTLFMATSGVHDIYQSTYLRDANLDGNDANGQILYSTDNGATWQVLHAFGHPVFWITLDPNNPNRAYASVIHYNGGAGVGGVYRCDDLQNLASSTWTLLSDPPRTEKHPASLFVLDDGNLIATYSGRRTAAGAFTASSGVFTYNPTSGAWTDLSHPGMHYWTKDIVIDPYDMTQNTWYVGVFSGWGGAPNGLGGLYKSTNRGVSWTKLTGNILDRVTSCTFSPINPDEIYLTTEGQGLWMSSDINNVTPTFSQVMSYPFRQPERVFFNPYNPNRMWVTSFGNGMKTGDLAYTGVPYFETESFLNVYPNPAEQQVDIEYTVEKTSEVDLQIFDMQGRLLNTLVCNQIQEGLQKITWAGTTDAGAVLPSGVYFMHLKIGGEISAKKIVLTGME